MKDAKGKSDYVQELRLAKSLLVVTSLQKRRDVAARKVIENYGEPLTFEPLHDLLIESQVSAAYSRTNSFGASPMTGLLKKLTASSPCSTMPGIAKISCKSCFTTP